MELISVCVHTRVFSSSKVHHQKAGHWRIWQLIEEIEVATAAKDIVKMSAKTQASLNIDSLINGYDA